MGKKTLTTTPEDVYIPIKWNVPDNIIARFATNMTAQIVDNVIKVSFFEIKPEMRLSDKQPIQKEIQADCVASVILTPDKLPKFVKALQDQYDNYIKLQSDIKTL